MLNTKNILLSTVFKPFGVDDIFGRKDNLPELMMAQITRVQGLFNYRIWHGNCGLHLIAANCNSNVTVLEWPSIDQFKQELKSQKYDYIGISFIPCTLLKMREMVHMCRLASPSSKIIIGGHGTLIPNLDSIVDVDYICKGEGIAFIRDILHQNLQFKIFHPLVTSKIIQFLGIPIKPMINSQIVTGIGCRNGCDFCVTSAFLNCTYRSFIDSGAKLYKIVKNQSLNYHINNFWLIDENFLQNYERANEFLTTVRNQRDKLINYHLDMIWSSYENVINFSPEELSEMGINLIWIGYESKYAVYKKNKNINLEKLIKSLAEYGIATLVSTVLFFDHHDNEKLNNDVSDVISSGLAYPQFLPLSAFPGTALYEKLNSKNRILNTIPWEERHVLNTGTHIHPFFPLHEQKQIVLDAYQKDYDKNGPSILRAFSIQLQGYNNFKNSQNKVLLRRANFIKPVMEHHVNWVLALYDLVNEKHRYLVKDVIKEIKYILGNSIIENSKPTATFLLKMAQKGLKERNGETYTIIQPKMRKTKYVPENPIPVQSEE